MACRLHPGPPLAATEGRRPLPLPLLGAALIAAAGCFAPRHAVRAAVAPPAVSGRGEGSGAGAVDPDGPATPGGAPPAGATESAPHAREPGLPVSGLFSLRPVLRNTSGASDVDLFAYLSVDGGDPERHPVTFHVSAAGAWDVDADAGDAFDGINDTFGSSVTGRLYDAWVDLHGLEDLPLVRVGRQSDYETPDPVLYDGVRVATRELGELAVRVGAYGGLANHLFESSPEGDWLGGVWVEGRPWQRGRARVDWLRARDELGAASESAGLLGLSLWQTVTSRLRARAAYTLLEGESRDLDLAATWFDPEPDLLVRATWYRLFETQAANPLEFNTFSTSLFDYFPFDRWSVTAAKGVTERLRVEGGLDLRDVRDDADEGTFNRDVQRYWLTGTLDRVFTEGTSVSLTGDLWASDEQHTRSLGASARQVLSELTEVSAGTYYALYEFDALLVAEREDVRVYYVSVEHELGESLVAEASFSLEDADRDFQTLRLKLLWRF